MQKCNLFDDYIYTPLSVAFQWISDFLSHHLLDGNIIIQYSAIIAGFISITIPIALDIISKQTEIYKDKEISGSFLKEWTYRFQLYFLLPIIYLSILIFALGCTKDLITLLVAMFDALAMIVFIFFIRVVQQFATNFDEYYSQKLKKESDEMVN